VNRTILRAGVLTVFLVPAFGQSPPPFTPTPSSALSDYTLFRAFFAHVSGVETAADSLKARGQNDRPMRSAIKNSAGLNDREASLLREIAVSSQRDLRAFETDVMMPALRAFTAKHAKDRDPSRPPPQEDLQQASSLEAQRQKIVTDYMQRLKSGIGDARFQRLYDFVKRTEGPNIRQGTLVPANGMPPNTTR